MPKKKTIVQKHEANFETLTRAFADGSVCLMDCIEKATGEHVAVICAVQPATDGSGEIETVPFARFFNGNPYEMLISPLEEAYVKS
jgi:Family of unknown function (DUF6117)